MKIKNLSLALACALPVTGTFAAALDRSGQSISAFLQPGNYVEAGVSVLDPNVSGREAGETATHRDVNNMANSYIFPSAALKLQVTDQFSFGLLYDQPFGAAASYSGENIFVSAPSDPILNGLPLTTGLLGSAAPTGSTTVSVHTQNLSMLFGFQPNDQINIYAGPAYQSIKGDVQLRGSTYSVYNGYSAEIKEDFAFGWLAGAAFQIPEIALKASLTYRSEIDHEFNAKENIALAKAAPSLAGSGAIPAPILPALGAFAAANNSQGKTTITTPQSVNLDFQTGIMANTIAFANVRWVDWSNFAIQPHKFGAASKAVGPLVSRPDGFNLVEYADDQWSATIGIGRKINEQWAGNISVGWDSGAGDPVSTLGPTEGYWNIGLGGQFSPSENYFVQAGVKYFLLGDAKAQTGAQAGTEKYVAEFKDNTAWGYGLKAGYRF